MRRFIIAGNWKMNAPDIAQFGSRLVLPQSETVTAVICPPFPFIGEAARDINVHIGAQDVSVHESGAYTGEVSAEQLRRAGAEYVIIGHSERRQYHGETDALVCGKVKAALVNGMVPIICVGETLEQRENGQAQQVTTGQVTGAFKGMSSEKAARCIVAYEPVWAIGTGLSATSQEAGDACEAIRATLRDLYGADTAVAISILYGGSMSPTNAGELLRQPHIDGGLIGGASLKAESFSELLGIAAEVSAESADLKGKSI